MSILHNLSSARRPFPLKDSDYDHKIDLLDHTQSFSTDTRNQSEDSRASSARSNSSSHRYSDIPLHKHGSTLRQDYGRRKWTKWPVPGEGGSHDGHTQDQRKDLDPATQASTDEIDQQDIVSPQERNRGRSRERLAVRKDRSEPDSAIDILYENQRGGFLCGFPMFSPRALGNLDPSPWTNIASKASATNITNAQVPDPDWEWAWKAWSVNKTDKSDDDGWEYSFAFAKKISWHSPAWWNSFVRRRAWIRRRVKKVDVAQSKPLNDDYFKIYPAHVLSSNLSAMSSAEESSKDRSGIKDLAKREMRYGLISSEDIHDIVALMNGLRSSRIDRQKLEMVESFLRHGGTELSSLKDHVHDIMRIFVFQASRQLLLAKLIQVFEERSNAEEVDTTHSSKEAVLESLQAAVTAAEAEVKRLEYWSDVKQLAESGHTKGALDAAQGWGANWAGLDLSGPRNTGQLPGEEGCNEDRNGATSTHNSRKGKEKE